MFNIDLLDFVDFHLQRFSVYGTLKVKFMKVYHLTTSYVFETVI